MVAYKLVGTADESQLAPAHQVLVGEAQSQRSQLESLAQVQAGSDRWALDVAGMQSDQAAVFLLNHSSGPPPAVAAASMGFSGAISGGGAGGFAASGFGGGAVGGFAQGSLGGFGGQP